MFSVRYEALSIGNVMHHSLSRSKNSYGSKASFTLRINNRLIYVGRILALEHYDSRSCVGQLSTNNHTVTLLMCTVAVGGSDTCFGKQV